MSPSPPSVPLVPPVALTIAGSDCSAGAGLQADLKTFQHFGVHGLSAVTCVVSETARVVRSVHPVPIDTVIDQASLLLESFPVAAVKTGMLFSADLIHSLVPLLQHYRPAHLIVDPVMVSSTGDSLLEAGAVSAYLNHLLPLACLTTPNIPEAEKMLECHITDKHSMESAAFELAMRLGISILLKGGHLDGDCSDDILIHENAAYWFSAPRLDVAASHGTGCTLSAGITACLAQGYDMPSAVTAAKQYLGRALFTSYTFPGPDPIHALNQATLPLNR